MRYIILAAGKSKRIYNKIKNIKCLIKVNGQTIISKAINEISKINKDSKITIVTGFNSNNIHKELRDVPNVDFLFNRDYRKADMLKSFYIALKKYNEDLVFCYSDIIFSYKSIKKIIKKKRGIYIPIKKNWKKIWKIRNKNPYTDAEDIKISNQGKVLTIGDKIKNLNNVKYQYMGIIFIPKKYRNILFKNYKNIKNKNKIHLTFFLNYLIKKNCPVYGEITDKFWYEFDDYDDYKNYKKFYN